jgi:SOS response regulatory protein OraA/RecX
MPVVTALREWSHGRVEVELDGAPWRLVPADAVVRSGLFVGRALDRERARALGRELRRSAAVARAARALRYRDRSRAALAERLAAAGVGSAARESALDSLERAGLVDDRRVAESRARALAERGYGDAAIRFALEGEGLAAELVAGALEALEPERERAERLRGRGARWLTARGFDAGTVDDLLGGFADGG